MEREDYDDDDDGKIKAQRDSSPARRMSSWDDNDNLPPVDSFGDLVALQGPPELAALGISSLHIPRTVSSASARSFLATATTAVTPRRRRC